MIDAVEIIKESVTCEQFADFMGLKRNRNGFAVCPFHGYNDASLKIYKGGRGWCCFGCHKGGDVINLARLYYGLPFKDTVKQIAHDFNIQIADDASNAQKSVLMAVEIAKRKADRAKKERKQAALEAQYWTAYEKWLTNERAIEDNSPQSMDDDFSPAFVRAIMCRNELTEVLTGLEMERIKHD